MITVVYYLDDLYRTSRDTTEHLCYQLVGELGAKLMITRYHALVGRLLMVQNSVNFNASLQLAEVEVLGYPLGQ